MFMIDMHLDSAKLMRFSHAHGHHLAQDEDFGYAVHSWLAAAFGDIAPQPFRLFERRDGLHLLGYSQNDASVLCEHAQTFAEPLISQVCRWDSVAGKSMPQTWTKGRRVGFEVRACPVSRKERERDVFLSTMDRVKAIGETLPSREQVYFDWLAQKMKAGIDTKGESQQPGQVHITGFRRVKVLRKDRSKVKSKNRAVERPDVIFSGELIILHPEQFSALLRRGVGRHRAFGFGMLLLRPPGYKR
jgi:CRISPR system Cascade subunit CasE